MKKFRKYKPWWVAKLKVSGKETCLSTTHENIKLLFKRLRYHKNLEVENIKEYIESICCDTFNKNYMERTFPNCQSFEIPMTDPETPTYNEKWISEKVSREGAKNKVYDVKITSTKKKDCTVAELVIELKDDLKCFTSQVHTVSHQLKELNILRENLKADGALVVIDFSQIYNCKYGWQFDGAHFRASKKQISLHTGRFYYEINEKIDFESCP